MFSKLLSYFRKTEKPEFVRVVYTLGNVPKKEYKMGNRIVFGAEGRNVYTNQVLKYRVTDRKIYIHIPIYFESMPFNLHQRGELSPAFDCKDRNIPVDYMFWIPEDYQEEL